MPYDLLDACADVARRTDRMLEAVFGQSPFGSSPDEAIDEEDFGPCESPDEGEDDESSGFEDLDGLSFQPAGQILRRIVQRLAP